VAVVIGALAVPTAASPVSIITPAGLNPGDRFRIAFVTGTMTVNAYDNIHSTTMNDPVYRAGGALVAPTNQPT